MVLWGYAAVSSVGLFPMASMLCKCATWLRACEQHDVRVSGLCFSFPAARRPSSSIKTIARCLVISRHL
jgi:hypothetical protein